MPTSMLDALAHEQNEILNLGIEASRLAIEAVRRANLLRQQIEALAAQERDAPPSIAADASEAEFLQFQAEHFPDLMLGEQEEIRDTPGMTPATQDDGAGIQGSAASVPGGAETRQITEVEQVVADAASGEQEARTPLRDDPEAAPDAAMKRDRALDLYATTDLSLAGIAKQVGSSPGGISVFVRHARTAGDPRAAQGDLRRQPPEHEEQPGLAIVTPTVPDGLPTIEPERPGSLLTEVDLNGRRITFDGMMIEVARHELRLVHILNDQRPKSVHQVMEHISAVSENRLRVFVSHLNARLAQIHLAVHLLPTGHYQLRRLQVA